MNLSFQSSLFLVVLFAAASVAISIAMYRQTVPQVSDAKRRTLIALRSAGLFFILIALCEPLLQFISVSMQKPTVALLVDNSLSMSQRDAIGNREEIARSIIASSSLQKLSSAAEIRTIAFSSEAMFLSADSFRCNGASTNIASALNFALKEFPANLHSIILLSDGNFNAGSNPLYSAERSRAPIFTIGIGDTMEQKDISVASLNVNSLAYSETTIPVNGQIKISGIGYSNLAVTLLEDGKQIAQKNITVNASPAAVSIIPFAFEYTPSSAGTKKITVSVNSAAGELTEQNNRRSALVKVLKNKLKIAILAGAPSADVSAVTSAINDDVNIEAVSFLQTVGGEIKNLTDKKTLQQSLNETDCIIFCGFPSQFTTQNSLQTIKEAVQQKNLPLLFLASRTIDFPKLRLLETLLPFSVAAEKIDEQSVFPSIPARQKFHQLINLNGNSADLWQKLPPIFYSLPTFKAKPEAIVLSEISLQGVSLPMPLIVLRNAAGMRSLAVLGYGIHRWKLLASANEETKGFFSVWFSAVVRWLSTRDADKRLRVEPMKEFFAQGEQIEFTAQAYNESYEPLDGAEISLNVRSMNGQKENLVEENFEFAGSGRYAAQIGTLPEGDYSYKAKATLVGNVVDSASGRFSVGEQQLEFTETTMNKTLMMQIASKSGGMYADAKNADSLFTKIASLPSLIPQEVTTKKEFELWNLPIVLSLIIVIFGIEWLIRKRSGML